MKRTILSLVMFALVTGCGEAAPPVDRTPVVPQAEAESATPDQEAVARVMARAAKRLAGLCESDADCDLIISPSDLEAARETSAKTFGKSAFGLKSARAPSTYLAHVGATPCVKERDACARDWFIEYRTAIIKALNEGDDSDTPTPIPSRDDEKTTTMPYTMLDIAKAGVSFETLDNVFECRTAIQTRRWLKEGGVTPAEFEAARAACLKPAVFDGP